VATCGRSQDKLNQLQVQHPGASLFLKGVDVSKEQECEQFIADVINTWGQIDVLINNAGIQNWMNITDDNFFQRAKEELAINVEAPLHLTSLFIKLDHLKTVMNVTSGLSFTPLTKVPVYSATKAFFHSFTLSLRHILKEKNIEVIEIIPPALNTDLGGIGLHDYAPPVSDFIAAIFEQLKNGNDELTFGFSEMMSKATPQELKATFDRMNAMTH
jgi:uncharacterized oxidoreductase